MRGYGKKRSEDQPTNSTKGSSDKFRKRDKKRARREVDKQQTKKQQTKGER